MIKVLKNPKTNTYKEFKKLIESNQFPWQFHPVSTRLDPKVIEDNGNVYHNISFYTHPFLMRPELYPKKRYPSITSPYTDGASEVFLEIFNYNNVKINSFLRIAVNAVHPFDKVLTTIPHADHPFDHENALIYLTDSGGCTIVNGEYHDPKEDDVITFSTKNNELHHHQTPKSERRVVLVATFI